MMPYVLPFRSPASKRRGPSPVRALRRTAIALAIAAPLAAQGATQRSLRVSEDKGSLRVENGLVSARFDKAAARLTSLRLGRDELLGGGGVGYFQMVAQGKAAPPARARVQVTRRGRAHVDVVFSFDAPARAFGVELHWVMRAGVPGLYAYAIVRFDPEQCAPAQLEQMDWAIRVDPRLFDFAHVDEARQRALPSPEELRRGEVLRPPESVRLPDGRVFDKYMLSVAQERQRVHGVSGAHHGAWVVQPSREDIGGGPSNRELSVHATKTTPVLLRMAHAGHYGSGRVDFGARDSAWAKLYGPWLLYFNETRARGKRARQALWRDAKKRAAREAKAWPYAWLEHELYPRARGSVRGRVGVGGACVVLAAPQGDGVPHWQRQGKGYQFWARSAADGRFTIEGVRPGRYALYAFVDGELGELRRDGVEVRAREATRLGRIAWPAPRAGTLLWQLGVPDRSAGEFAGAENVGDFGTWAAQKARFPGGVRYVVGESDPAEDWYYQHANERDAKGVWRGTERRVLFDVADALRGRARLTIAIASARTTGLRVFLGERLLGEWPELVTCGANCRYGLRGYYREKSIDFDASALRVGRNVLRLVTTRRGEFSGVMYDCLRLERIE